MKIRAELIMDGPGPNERLIKVTTADGRSEEVVVHENSFSNGYLQTSRPLAVKDKRALIELPRESVSGNWRLWVKEDAVVC
ncbi:hypothetical protein WME90_36340 [Sorangium sp. So ce375]|uniref:hypothetical protein n=1 Tax=Sorangium sp. So ce375 TaxID=3133306 RepID=UPI003F5BA244